MPMKIMRFADSNSGVLGVIEFPNLDFVPQRLYWLSDLVPGSIRGNHAHKTLRQAIFVVQGSINVVTYRGYELKQFELSPQSDLLIISPGTWREFWTDEIGSVLAVICDQKYDEADYIRDFNEYQNWWASQS